MAQYLFRFCSTCDAEKWFSTEDGPTYKCDVCDSPLQTEYFAFGTAPKSVIYKFTQDFTDPRTGEVLVKAGQKWTMATDAVLRDIAANCIVYEHDLGSGAWPLVQAIHAACVAGALQDWRNRINQ